MRNQLKRIPDMRVEKSVYVCGTWMPENSLRYAKIEFLHNLYKEGGNSSFWPGSYIYESQWSASTFYKAVRELAAQGFIVRKKVPTSGLRTVWNFSITDEGVQELYNLNLFEK